MAHSAPSPSASAPPKWVTCSQRSACCSASRRPSPSTWSTGLPPGVTAKDLILAIIGKIGVSGGTGHVLEFRGPAIEALSMDERMTMCNMSIEAGARAGMIAPDATTFDISRGHAARAQGRRLGARARALEQTTHRCRRGFRPQRGHRCGIAGAHGHLWHPSRHGRARSRAMCPRRAMRCSRRRSRTWGSRPVSRFAMCR